MQPVFTLPVKCRLECEQGSWVREILSFILRTMADIACVFTKQPWIVEVPSNAPFCPPAVKRDFVQTSRRESRRANLRVTQFASSSQDTLQQLAPRELLCNYQQQQQGKRGRGQTLCHPMGEHQSQFQCLKFMMKCT